MAPRLIVRVQVADFAPGALLDELAAGDHGIGGITSFIGLVRDFAGDGSAAMTLEHYPGMTERELTGIAQEALERWPLAGLVIVHRYGRLLPGDRIVFAAAASAHRQATFDACAFLMDWLKTQAPFWKLEESTAGRHWVEAKDSDDAAAERWRK